VYVALASRLTTGGTPVPGFRGKVVEAIRTGIGGQPREASRTSHGPTSTVEIKSQSLLVLRRSRNGCWGAALTRRFLINIIVRGATVLSSESDLLGRVTEGGSASHVDTSGRRGAHQPHKLSANGAGDFARTIGARRDTTNGTRGCATATTTAATAAATCGAALHVGRARAFTTDVRTTATEGSVLTLSRARCGHLATFDVGRTRAHSTFVAASAGNSSVLASTTASLHYKLIRGSGVSF